MEKRRYGLFVRTGLDYARALETAKAALKEQGFGVLTEIDVAETMKQKLGAEFRRYDIIGACNPPLAHEGLTKELDLGLLLPCNVIVYEDDDGSVVGALDPEDMMQMARNPDLEQVATQAKRRLEAALKSVEAVAAAA